MSRIALLPVLVLLLCINGITAVVAAEPAEALSQIQWLEDRENRYPDLQALQAGSPSWQPLQGRVFSAGFNNRPHWFRLSIEPVTGKGTTKRYLQLPEPMVNEVDLYFQHEGRPVVHHDLGTEHPFFQRPLAHPHFVAPVILSRTSATNVYIRMRTNGSLQFEPVLWHPDDFVEATRIASLKNGFYYGAMLIMILYNLFIYFVVRDRSYLYYISFVASFTLFQAALLGDAYQFLWPGLPVVQGTAIAFLIAMMNLSALAFTRSFLNLAREWPNARRLVDLMMGISALLLPLALWLEYALSIRLVTGYGLLLMVVILVISVRRWTAGSHHARYFVLAWVALLLGTMALNLSKWGVLPWNAVTANAAQIGALAEVVLLSFALGDRIRIERLQRFAAQQQALYSARQAQSAQQAMLESQEKANLELEQRVGERTHELEEALTDLERANQRLETLSQTDQLTGLGNRYLFVERFEEEYRRARRKNHSLALILLDIDHFKDYNDRYGHQAGDDCLVEISRALAEAVARAGDTLARYGGEEFIVLLSDTDREGACIVAERLRQVVASTPVSVDGKRLSLSVSLGVAACIPGHGEDREELIQRCDKALYEAKNAGRNRVRAWPLEEDQPLEPGPREPDGETL